MDGWSEEREREGRREKRYSVYFFPQWLYSSVSIKSIVCENFFSRQRDTCCQLAWKKLKLNKSSACRVNEKLKGFTMALYLLAAERWLDGYTGLLLKETYNNPSKVNGNYCCPNCGTPVVQEATLVIVIAVTVISIRQLRDCSVIR